MITADQVLPFLDNCLEGTKVDGFSEVYIGKVRDNYITDDGKRVLVTTDRQSAFDRNLGLIPLKGQALTQLATWWFEKTADIVKNHMIEVPDPNIVVGKNVTPVPIEMVIRGYLTGSTGTSSWTAYNKGERLYCGHQLPDGMKKNDSFPESLITPTTKSDVHDENLDYFSVRDSGLVDPAIWDQMVEVTFALFARGQELAKKGGLILVDTKYEFGVDEEGTLVLIDEIHTSDSSRYWKAETYEERIAAGEEPENFDKEFLRLWFRERCDPYNDETLPEMPPEFRTEVALRYIETYERITGQDFVLPEGDVQGRVEAILTTMVS
jgi:phosphoribosylaminoimidazole-succinocarboxamide synthase